MISPLMTEVVWPFDEDIVPIDEAAVAQNHDLIDAIINAEVSRPVMTPDEFKAWLDQQHANPIFAAARRNPSPAPRCDGRLVYARWDWGGVTWDA